MRNIKSAILIIICVLFSIIRSSAQTDSTITNKDTTVNYKDSMRGQRYCEVVLAKVSLPNITITVYNTLGLNACPVELWKNINTDKLKKEFSVHTVIANGPRYYLMDKIGIYNNGDTTTTTFDSLQTKQWARIRMGIGAAMKMQKIGPYQERAFKLPTAKFFNKGSVVFELVSPEHTYIMESYSQEVDSTLNESSLANLSQKLKLPDGWQFKVITLDNDLQLITTESKEAYGIEDELANRYQRID